MLGICDKDILSKFDENNTLVTFILLKAWVCNKIVLLKRIIKPYNTYDFLYVSQTESEKCISN